MCVESEDHVYMMAVRYYDVIYQLCAVVTIVCSYKMTLVVVHGLYQRWLYFVYVRCVHFVFYVGCNIFFNAFAFSFLTFIASTILLTMGNPLHASRSNPPPTPTLGLRPRSPPPFNTIAHQLNKFFCIIKNIVLLSQTVF